MDRRKSLKLIATGAIAVPAVIAGCKPGEKEEKVNGAAETKFNLDRNPDEIKSEKEILAREKFFTDDELKTITVLADIIIPKDEVSGSASEAGVPEFIASIVKEKTDLQVPLRGGLRWLDMQCLKKYSKPFKDCTSTQQIEMVDAIAYPEKASKSMSQGVKFFTLIRNLTVTAFYTSKIGVKDLGYLGNTQNQWNGVPADVLAQYNLSYTEKELKECI